jgi:hypothetical protein
MPQHEKLIRASAIDPEVARERGYFSAMTERDLDAIGLPRYVSTWVDDGCGCAGPGPLTWGKAPLSHGLAFPVWNVHGEIAFYMLRPDRPRADWEFKPVKYERPPASRNVLDIHPRVRDRLLDAEVPLYITEGTRKVDAAVSAGLCCIGSLGVWGWRSQNDEGKSAPLDDFEAIAFDGREVVIVFDSDVVTKSGPRRACRALKEFLASLGASVKVLLLPAGPADEKVGLDDFLAAGSSLNDVAELVLPESKVRQRRSRYSRGSRSDIYEQTWIAIRLLGEATHDRDAVKILMEGFGISEKTARLRLKGARGKLDASRHPRLAAVARRVELRMRVTDARSNRKGEEKKSPCAQSPEFAAPSTTATSTPGELRGHDVQQPNSFILPLLEVDHASVTPTRYCEQCGGTFAPQRSDARFCSSRCRQRAYRRRNVGAEAI